MATHPGECAGRDGNSLVIFVRCPEVLLEVKERLETALKAGGQDLAEVLEIATALFESASDVS